MTNRLYLSLDERRGSRHEDYDLSHSSSEDRWRALGLLGNRVIVVIYAYRGDVIRLISARYAEPHEEQKYFEEAFGEPW
jgi:uncharacterized DUF497 family protein